MNQLATELTRIRQRGIDRVDQSVDRRQPVRTPALDQLLSTASSSSELAHRGVLLRAFLHDELDRYHAVAPHGADFVRQLFFDAEGRAPGPGGPTGLLRTARTQHHLSEAAFRRLQREHFVQFARFLLLTQHRPARAHARLGWALALILAGLVFVGAALLRLAAL